MNDVPAGKSAKTVEHPRLLQTKLHRPPPANDLVARPHLLERLEPSVRSPLTCISAPAGYGKSTLISHWLEDAGLTAGWVSLDEGDNDLRNFASYFVAALRTVVRGIGEPTMTQLENAALPGPSALITPLANELDSVEQAVVQVLDDYHFIHDSAVHEFVAALLRHPPKSLHLVIVTRRDPPLPLAALRARGSLVEIRAKDLRFSVDETVEFLSRASGGTIDTRVAKAVSDDTEGWVTAIRLTALSLRNEDTREEVLSALRSQRHFVTEYLIGEVFSRQPEAVRTYLLAASILGRFCAPLCEALIARSFLDAPGTSGQEFIDCLVRENLFIVPLDAEHTWFRYHHLLQGLLETRAKERFGADKIAELHGCASDWLTENGWLDEALQHALESEQSARAVEIVVANRRELVNQEEFIRLRRWLDALPPGAIENEPELLLAEAWMAAGFPELAGLLDRIEAQLTATERDSDIEKRLRAELVALRSLCSYDAGDGAQALAQSEKALQELPLDQISDRAFALIVNAWAYQMLGDIETARAVLFEHIREKETKHTTFHARMVGNLCYLSFFEADAAELRRAGEEYLKMGEELGLAESVQHARYFLAVDAYDRNELERVVELLVPIVGEQRIVTVHNYLQCAFVLGLAYQALGRESEALGVADAVARLALDAGSTAMSANVAAFQAELALRQGRLDEVVRWVSRFEPELLGRRCFLPELTYVKALLAGGDPESLDRADAFLLELEERFTSTHNRRFSIQVLAARALVFGARGLEDDANASLERALEFARSSRPIRSFVDLGPALAKLLQRSTKSTRATTYVGEILGAFRNDAVRASKVVATDQPLVEPLSKRELEILSLLAERLSNPEIGEKLFISPETVKRHTINIYGKLGVNGRREAVSKAVALSILRT